MLVSLVIPVFNEAAVIDLLVRKIHECLQAFEWQLLFVNDGSTDDTRDVLQRTALNDPCFHADLQDQPEIRVQRCDQRFSLRIKRSL
jgi:glycosyltransferase involved in cell wall biosynthesis